MSTFQVEIVKIDSVMPHPNADRLDLIKVLDWQVVTQKGIYKPGDKAVYIPIDSLLSPELECKIFPPDSKIKLNNSRIRTIRLRGAISQGMLLNPKEFDLNFVTNNITKYEPPVKLSPGSNANKSTYKQSNPNFRKYTGIENAKNYPSLFTEGEEVVVTCKIHGTNFRCGYVPFYADTVWKKVQLWLGLAPKQEFVYASHNVQLQNKMLASTYYDKNVYAEAVQKYNLKEILKPGEVIYGEIYGDGIQKGYNYGCKSGERKFVGFEVRVNDVWLDPLAAKKWFEERQLPFVPVLYVGPYNKEKVLALRDGPSVLCSQQKIREGCVVRSIKEEQTYIGRKILKLISDDYLLTNQDNETVAH